jgi:hypothetical protein
MALSPRQNELIGPVVVFGLVYLICCWVMVSGWRDEYWKFRLGKIGMIASATVTESNPRSLKIPAELKYEFRVDVRTFNGSEFVSTATQRAHPPSSVVVVKYLPEAPGFCRLERNGRGLRGSVVFVGLCLITVFVLGLALPVAWAVVTGRVLARLKAAWLKAG